MKKLFQEALEQTPVIAAIKDDAGLERCLQSDCGVVFILYGTICNISAIVERVKSAGKLVLVHVDLIDGLSNREVAVDFLKQYTRTDGIISTKAAQIKRAGELGLCTVLRLFALDSMAYENIARQVAAARPDVIEVLPGMMPKIIARICDQVDLPVITGGLVSEREDVYELLSAGAISVSTTKTDVWFL